jgi:hypothetical protein
MSQILTALALSGAIGGLLASYIPARYKPDWAAIWEGIQLWFDDDDDDLPGGGHLAGAPA